MGIATAECNLDEAKNFVVNGYKPYIHGIYVIAASPLIQETGMTPVRIVLRESDSEYIVHSEGFEFISPDSDRIKSYFIAGNYFTKSNLDSFERAWTRFEERVRRLHGLPTMVPQQEFMAKLRSDSDGND